MRMANPGPSKVIELCYKICTIRKCLIEWVIKLLVSKTIPPPPNNDTLTARGLCKPQQKSAPWGRAEDPGVVCFIINQHMGMNKMVLHKEITRVNLAHQFSKYYRLNV